MERLSFIFIIRHCILLYSVPLYLFYYLSEEHNIHKHTEATKFVSKKGKFTTWNLIKYITQNFNFNDKFSTVEYLGMKN